MKIGRKKEKLLNIPSNLGQISDIEGVMHFSRRGLHVRTHSIVDSNAGGHHGEQAFLHFQREVAILEESSQTDLVNVLEGTRGRVRQGEHAV